MNLSKEEALRLFNLKADFTIQELKRRYRELTRQWHPDLNHSPNAEEIMGKINLAYEVLQEAVGTFGSSECYIYKHISFFDVERVKTVVVQNIKKVYKHVSFFDVVKE